MALLVLCYVLVAGFVGYLLYKQYRFDKSRSAIRYRIHVSGTRGKPNVTRYVAAILRGAGVETYGRTAGTTARIILPNGEDAAIRRGDTPRLTHQLNIIRSFANRQAQAIVMEIPPLAAKYLDWLEHRIMQSHIVVITNVRADQQSKLNEASIKAARRFARLVPNNGYLVTAERQPELLDILAQECARRHSQLIAVKGDAVTLKTLPSFNHITQRDDLAIGLAVAKLVGVPTNLAMLAMAGAKPDPKAPRLDRFIIAGKEVIWANLFAIKDRQSFTELSKLLVKQFPDHYRIVLLNNRKSRPNRVARFSKLAQTKAQAHAIVALGAYEDEVRASLQGTAIPVASLGNTSAFAQAGGDALLSQILSVTNHPKVLLIGAANIRSRQADRIVRFIRLASGSNDTVNVPTYELVQKQGPTLVAKPGKERFPYV